MVRRVIASLRQQDWTNVAVELLVVVVGVFIVWDPLRTLSGKTP